MTKSFGRWKVLLHCASINVVAYLIYYCVYLWNERSNIQNTKTSRFLLLLVVVENQYRVPRSHRAIILYVVLLLSVKFASCRWCKKTAVTDRPTDSANDSDIHGGFSSSSGLCLIRITVCENHFFFFSFKIHPIHRQPPIIYSSSTSTICTVKPSSFKEP